MKRIVWFQGWMDLTTGEMSLDLCTYHKKEDRIIFLKILKELKRVWKKVFRDMKKTFEINCKISEGKISPAVRNDYRVYVQGKEKIKKRKKTTQKGGYNE